MLGVRSYFGKIFVHNYLQWLNWERTFAESHRGLILILYTHARVNVDISCSLLSCNAFTLMKLYNLDHAEMT